MKIADVGEEKKLGSKPEPDLCCVVAILSSSQAHKCNSCGRQKGKGGPEKKNLSRRHMFSYMFYS